MITITLGGEVKLKGQIELKCAGCSGDLKAIDGISGTVISVTPCQACMEKAIDDVVNESGPSGSLLLRAQPCAEEAESCPGCLDLGCPDCLNDQAGLPPDSACGIIGEKGRN